MKKLFTTLFLALFALAGYSKNTFITGEYTVTLKSLSPLKISVNANVPINGRTLDLSETYPADLPEMEKNGWSALISNLKVFALSGKEITITKSGNKGWLLTDSIKSIIRLSYDVDYSLLAKSGWSSFLESAFADDSNIIVVGSSIFITTKAMSEAKVKFVTPKDWISIVPWTGKSSQRYYTVKSIPQLLDNMLVFSRNKPSIIHAGGFTIQVVSMGHWRPLGSIVDDMIKTIITKEVDLMNYKEKEIYNVVLVPVSDKGGNSFHQSFVYCYNDPTNDNKDIWGNTLAHEIFHYWNSSKLEGADYASSQWFQEGFTEYVANLILLTGNIIDSTTFLNKLSTHVNNYRRLKTTLENYGTRKGPPLYSAGALVAFMWDVQIREATNGKYNIGNFFRNLMVQTDSGNRKYTWTDIKAALKNTADIDWESSYQSYIRGNNPLPLDEVFPLVSLHLIKLTNGSEQVAYNNNGSNAAKNLFHKIIGDSFEAN